MDDLISRQAAIDDIKAVYEWHDTVTEGRILDHLRRLPPAQPEIIRCKDCKFSKAYYHGSESNLGMFTYLCTRGLYGMNADDYCSLAERKEE